MGAKRRCKSKTPSKKRRLNTEINDSSKHNLVKSNKSVLKCNCVHSQSPNGNFSGVESDKPSLSFEQSSAATSVTSPPARQKCCIKQRLWSVFGNEHLSDVVFIVGQGKEKQRICAHKLVLCLGSDVFKVMFGENWSSESAEIAVPDVEPVAFTALLGFLYVDEINLTSDTVIAILYAARKYDVRLLENLCVDFLIKNLCPDNAFTVLNVARLLDLQKLVNACLEAVDKDTVTAVASDAFCKVNIKTLCLVLDRDLLTINEVQLFKAILRWSEAECTRKNLPVNKKNQLSVATEALPLIRFPLMPVEEFTSHVAQSGFLSKDELLSMYFYFTAKLKPTVKFKDVPRVFSGRELIVNRLTKIDKSTFACPGGTSDQINFTCDHGLELLGYGLHSSKSGSAKYNVKLQLIGTLENVALRNESADIVSDGALKTYKALFKNPIKLIALKKYTAYVCIKGPECLTGGGGLEEVTMELPHGRKITVTFSSYSDPKCSNPLTTVNKGLIPQLIFKA